MIVRFVSGGGPHLASWRLRQAAPSYALRRLGVEVLHGWGEADVHVFSKHWDKSELELARRCANPVFDICDDHFAGPHGDYYRAMCMACEVVVSSARLGEIVTAETGKPATVIPEPYELPDGAPKEPGEDPVALWFGHGANLEELNKARFKGKLIVCSNVQGRGIVPYSPENLQRCLEACDFVIIPQSRDWKSANRMVESLRAGRFVVASDIPAYRGFHQYLGDINAGAEWLRSGDITRRIISGREELPSFSPQRIGQMWYDFISGVVKRSSGTTAISTPSETRTNTQILQN